jgi:type II secretory pathway pseudopilin PulG
MIVVVAIIAVLATMGMYAFNSGNQSLLMTTAASQVLNTISAARQLSATTNAKTRFAILLDENPNKDEWRLRGYFILREELGLAVEAGQPYFSLASPVELLKTGVYFAPDRAEEEKQGEANQMINRTDVVNVQGVAGARYAYIEFNPTGAASHSTRTNIFRIERGLGPGEPMPNSPNFARIGVAQHTGRVKMERSE